MECIHLCALVCVGFYLQLCVAVKEISISEEQVKRKSFRVGGRNAGFLPVALNGFK